MDVTITDQKLHAPSDRPFTDAAIGQAFPHKALTQRDVYPPITLAHLEELRELWGQYIEAHPESPYAEAKAGNPAIVVALFKGPFVKYLCSADEIEGTIANIRAALTPQEEQ